MQTFTNLRGRVVRLAFAPEGTTLAAVVRGAMQIGLWELPAGTFRRWHPYIDDAVSTVGYSPSGKWLVVGGEIGLVLPYIRARDNYDSEMYAGRAVDSVAFSSRVVKGRTVVAVGGDDVRLYDLDAPYGTNKKTLWGAELPSPKGWFRSVAFHPTADVLIGCSTSGTRGIHVWNPITCKAVRPVVVRRAAPTSAAFSATGAHLLVAYGQHIQLIDTETWGTRKVCEHASGKVTDVAASPNGDWFATAGTDGTVRFWDSATGKPGRVFDWKSGAVTAVAFSPDGLTCAAGGENGQVVVWDVDT
jgi:WD40 repeat protein